MVPDPLATIARVIIAIEGIDGAGKQTLAEALETSLADDDRDVTSVAFPRYDVAPFGPAIGAALGAPTSVLRSSVEAMAVAYAADRWHFWTNLTKRPSWLITDRWCASNAAYGAARISISGGDAEAFIAWVESFEFGDLGLPQPDLTVLLATGADLASVGRSSRQSEDKYETNSELQALALRTYVQLAESSFGGQWLVLDPLDSDGRRVPAEQLVAELTGSDEFGHRATGIA